MAAFIATMFTTPVAALCTLVQGASCAISTVNLASCLCQGALGRKTGISPTAAKLFYTLLLGLASFVAMVLRYHSEKFNFGAFGDLNCAQDGSFCKGDQAVFRISFILVLFFTLMMILSLGSRPSRFDQQFSQPMGATHVPQPYQATSNGNGQFGANSQFTNTNAPFQRDNSPVPAFVHTSVQGYAPQPPPQAIQHHPYVHQQPQQQQHLNSSIPQHMVKIAIDQTHYQPSAIQPHFAPPFPPQPGGRPY